ncbi:MULTISPECIES: TrbC/VirB2 family protein [Brevundimonas]|uniref:TrbC/VirB2 family protein n=1 Tax=Brevundimonas TaxID=41275 RepID=UPI00068E34BF|nr:MULTISPECIES: TrbC/VirB2 family protein [Brevundimonas]RSB43063.1 conjugal transfer protein TrbC [Brevundimonas sp. 357]
MNTQTKAGRLAASLKKSAPMLAVGVLAVTLPGIVEASSSGAGLPWENGLQTLQRSITGPVAMVISLLGIVVTGAMLIWGGEMNEFVRKMVMLIFVIALIVGASSILTTLFGVGAMIALPAGMVALS